MQANEYLTTLSLTVFTQRNFVSDFIPEKCNFYGKRAFCVFEPAPPPLWGLKSNVRWSSWSHWKARSRLPVSKQISVKNRRFRSYGGRLTLSFR